MFPSDSASSQTPTLATLFILWPPPPPPHTQGFALGNKDAISALESVKAPIDFNQYLGARGRQVQRGRGGGCSWFGI